MSFFRPLLSIKSKTVAFKQTIRNCAFIQQDFQIKKKYQNEGSGLHIVSCLSGTSKLKRIHFALT